MTLPFFDEGSFRDPEGHVFYFKNKVYRTIDPSAVGRMKSLIGCSFFSEWAQEYKIIPTQVLRSDELFPKEFSSTEYVLNHEKVPYITYPFEWTFSMLREGALLSLDLMQVLLKNGYILKDGTAWNVCFYKGKPCFYDILSIETYREGQPWEGLFQFLQEFLYPLMLQAYHGIDFQPIWRATQQGVPLHLLYKTLSKTSLFKKGVFKYVFLQQKFSANKTIARAHLKEEFSAQTFPKKALQNLINDLKKCIQSLHVSKDHSVWKNYDSQNSYKEADTRDKESFIERGLKILSSPTVIDLGCNTGRYSFLASKFSSVISCDLDPSCLDDIYTKKNPNVLPVVLNLMTPSPAMGWRLTERKDVFSRLKADSFMALALIHHLCISCNVPLKNFVRFLHSMAPQGIVEWVDKSDPMVQFLLRNRADIFKDYTLENFEVLLSECFKIQDTLPLNDGTRKLILLCKK